MTSAITEVLNKSIADDECYVYLDQNPNPTTTTTTMANAIISQAGQSVGSGQIVNENGYRYEGANPNNYVCFGSDASSCPADNLYRIIGVFNEYNSSSGSMQRSYVVKVIKNDRYGNTTYTFGNYPGYNTNASTAYAGLWFPNGTSSNQAYYILNTTYYNALPSKYQSMIANSRWYQKNAYGQSSSVGTSWHGDYNASTFYSNERSGSAIYSSGSFDTKIALMYVSDYAYGALSSNCSRSTLVGNFNSSSSGDNQTCVTQNWFLNDRFSWNTYEYTLNPLSYYNSSSGYRGRLHVVYHHASDNYGYWTNVNPSSSYSLRPSFYLNARTVIYSGNGTQGNPYRILL